MKDISELRSVRDCIAFAKSINPKKEPLTIEKLRTFPGCEHYSDQEVEAVLRTIEQLTLIAFELMMTGALPEQQSTKIVCLEPKKTEATLIINTKAA